MGWSCHKKEKPLPGLIGFGGGATSLIAGGSQPVIEASGGTTSEPGDGYKYHHWNSNGSLVVTEAGPADAAIEYCIVAGGGGGGNAYAGGGGAGGVREGSYTSVTATTYPVTVGGGGQGVEGQYGKGDDGQASEMISIPATGGGGGGGGYPQGQVGDGGSGGGGSFYKPSPVGQGNAGGYSPPEGNPGGSQVGGYPNGAGGGGGGAGRDG